METNTERTVYVVSDGDYSDYHICCICSTMKKAEIAKDLYAAYNDIAEVVLDEMPEHPDGMFLFSVDIERNGDVHSVRLRDASFRKYKYTWQKSNHSDRVFMYVWARDEKHAIKIAGERRAQLIASNLWGISYAEWHGLLQNGEIPKIEMCNS